MGERKRAWQLAAVTIAVALLLLAAGLVGTARAQDESVADGQSIFQRGVTLDGVPIPYTFAYGTPGNTFGPGGGMGPGMMGGGYGYGGMMGGYGPGRAGGYRGMMGGYGGYGMQMACATCHGADGHGRSTPMILTPNITYANLTDPSGMIEPSGDRGPTYTDDEIRTAIRDGVAADGDILSGIMPRWQLTDDQMNDLLAYLKTLP